MKLKKILSLLLTSVTVLCLTAMPTIAQTQSSAETRRMLMNVALHKPVTVTPADNSNEETHPAASMTDGIVINSFHAPINAGILNTISVDLQRRYPVKKIELYARYYGEETVARKNFRIIGSNDADLENYDVLGEIGDTENDNIFPNNGKFTVELDGNKSYRYIAVERTAYGWYLYAELKVYAEVSATCISQNATAHSAAGSYQGFASHDASKTVDGDISTTWLTDYVIGANHDLTVDLQAEYPVEIIELGACANYATPHLHNKAEIYGSNEILNDDEINLTTYLTEQQGYDKLASIGMDETDGGVDDQFFTADDGNDYFFETVLSKKPYRYITFKKQGTEGAGGASAIAEVKAYVINPEVQNINVSSRYLSLSFGDEMNFDNAASLISLVDNSGTTVVSGGEKADDYTYRLDISELDKDASYTLKVSKEIKNLKGVCLAEDYECKLPGLDDVSVGGIKFYDDDSGREINSLHSSKKVSAKLNVTNGSENDYPIGLYLARYTKDGALTDVKRTALSVPSGKSADIKTYIESADGFGIDEYVKAFAWDAAYAPATDDAQINGKLKDVYVSVYGNDNASGSITNPFATIERAKAEVASYSSNMAEDVNVYIREGVYTLSDTLVFDENDSGKNGHYVNYSAYNGENVTISGGTKIDGDSWEKYSDSIYMTKLDGTDSVRELYVNGRRMTRARSEERVKPLAMYRQDTETEYDGSGYDGYYMDSADIGVYKNPSDIQLKYARGWSSFILNAEDIKTADDGRVIVTMKQPAFKMITKFIPDESTPDIPIDGEKYYTFWLSELNKFYIENALELLDTPGEFYFDKTDKILYYMPDGDEMSTAEVYVPTLEKLICVSGTDLSRKTKNIRFTGLKFTHATDFSLDGGRIGDQAQTSILTEAPKASYQPDNIIKGANIVVSAAQNIEFENNVFTGLAEVGVGLYDGANDIKLNGNVFADIGDSAITVGLPSDAYIDDTSNGKNVALHKPVTCSKEEWGNFAAYANDGDAKRGWNIIWDGDYTDEYWQVDLGRSYNIDRVVLKQREYINGEVERRNFAVLGSNDENFADGGVVLAQQGNEMYAETGDFVGKVDETVGAVRYVRVVKTVNEYFYLPEIEVISYDDLTPSEEVCKNDIISNNYITRVGFCNSGAPGIQTYYTEGTDIAQNHVKDVPYSGICMGWGWINTPDSTTCKNNKIRNNVIEDYAQICFDAGGIYTLGQAPGSVISGNYIKNEINAYGAYYPDSGSSQYTVTGNVFENVDISYHIHSAYQTYLTVKNNYSTMPFYYDRGENCDVDAPILFVPTREPAEVKNIINNAGLGDEYKNIVNKTPTIMQTLTFDDMYGNVLEEDHPNILEMPGSVLVRTYLSYRIQEADSLLEMTKDEYTYDEDAYSKLCDVLERAKDMAKDHASMMAADRTQVIETRLELIAAMREFCEKLT